MLKIFNTLTRKKEKFQPINSGKVDIYVCGVTVYDFCHIGHARTFMFFDFVVKYLQHFGYSVNYVRNITDIDDKIINQSMKNGESYRELTHRMIIAMHNDFNVLNMIPPNHEPRVTQYINNIIEFISLLLNKKRAYIASNGDVLFSIENQKNYNILSRQNLKKLYVINDTNINVKKHPMDFVLWKKNNHIKSYEVSWLSPWGLGRPGWHIECSAMSYALLGKRFDIHGGGTDLIFPHHENEIAQSTAIHESSYVNLWMHVNMVRYDSLKMSKSTRNFFTIRDILKVYDPETVRYFLLSVHYRSLIDYTHENINQARTSLEHLYLSLKDTVTYNKEIQPKKNENFILKFISMINNDFNIPGAYSVLFEIAHIINRLKKQNKNILEIQNMAFTLRYLGKLLGFLNQDPEIFLKKLYDPYIIQNKNIIKEIELLIKERDVARKKSEWMIADQIRYKLFSLGVKLEDSPNGTVWRFIG